ncbi:hypothetical protein [Chelatococcus reniformis]|uniref:Uncharacterized protein n=1 Tax=Chelatococcus reniformis TaxID=1494448 RepID=A0A916U391_9HYPH|nr:hypothetical protein [Chelatococcus reniformis]GGC55479.1 hypothetical protein GCM10010994_12930 [Chelatococcus reniformis]
MESTITGEFSTRRSAELAIEHLVQELHVERTDIFVHAKGEANSAGSEISGADAESGHPGVGRTGTPELNGAIEVSVDCHGPGRDAIEHALSRAGARQVSTL